MSFVNPCISFLVGGWRNREDVLFCFLCKLRVGFIDFRWPQPSPSQLEGAVQKESSTQDLNVRAGGQQKVGGGQGVTGAHGESLLVLPRAQVLCAQPGFSLKHLEEIPTFL